MLDPRKEPRREQVGAGSGQPAPNPAPSRIVVSPTRHFGSLGRTQEASSPPSEASPSESRFRRLAHRLFPIIGKAPKDSADFQPSRFDRVSFAADKVLQFAGIGFFGCVAALMPVGVLSNFASGAPLNVAAGALGVGVLGVAVSFLGASYWCHAFNWMYKRNLQIIHFKTAAKKWESEGREPTIMELAEKAGLQI